MRILVVDDEPNAVRILAKGLREHAYAVDTAGNGAEALRMVLANEYDVLLLDVMLPGKDGLTVCRELRGAGNSVPILMLTARDNVENKIAGLDCGADDYLVKPFDFRELLARAAHCCGEGLPAAHTARDGIRADVLKRARCLAPSEPD